MSNSCVGMFMKFEGCEGGNGSYYMQVKSVDFVLSVGFLCVPVFLYISTLILVL